MRPSELVPGNCYFTIGYYDSDLLLPVVQTLRYVGCQLDERDGRQWVFHDLGQTSVVLDGSDRCRPASLVMPDDQLHGVLDFSVLIERLSEVAVDHPLSQPPPSAGPASGADLSGLEAHISRFFTESDTVLLTITVEFTNDGLSFSRFSDGTTNLLLSARPRLDPKREAALRAACEAVGLVAAQDYLANRGRSRILVYPIRPESWGEAAKLAARIFLDIYHLRSGDRLKFHWNPT